MTARTGMSALIEQLRAMTDAGETDYSVAGVYYWSDDQLQDKLDKTQQILNFRRLTPIPQTIAGGSVSYTDYKLPKSAWVEQGSSGGSAIFILRNSTGAIMPSSNYSVNYRAGIVTFTANTLGTAYWADMRVYNLNQIAAEVWRWKAANVTKRVDWQTDNHDIKASQERKACLEMAMEYARMGGARTVQMVRGDMA